MAKQIHAGIPGKITLEKAQMWVESRVSPRRFLHIQGVARTAKELAAHLNCNQFLAELAGWLHDCCKELKDTELLSLAKRFGIKLNTVEKENPHLLHGPVGALFIRQELNITNKQVLDAIAEHTLGAIAMSNLSKAVFLADCLEPGRSAAYTQPIWAALAGVSGADTNINQTAKPQIGNKVDTDHAILVACDLGLKDLIESGRIIHPKTVGVRNYYLNLVKNRKRSS